MLPLYDTPDMWRQAVLRDSPGVPVEVLFLPCGTGYRYPDLRGYDVQTGLAPVLMGLAPLWV